MHCGKAKRRFHASHKFTKLSHGSLLHDSHLNIRKKKNKISNENNNCTNSTILQHAMRIEK